MRWLRIPMTLRGFTEGELTRFALSGALRNVMPQSNFFWYAGMTVSPFAGLVPMFVGNLLGTVLVLYTLRFALVNSEAICAFRLQEFMRTAMAWSPQSSIAPRR